MERIAIVVHGGAGAPEALREGCAHACRGGFDLLVKGASALDAASEAVRLMEDDGRFNAGTGAILRLDGKTREMDAAVMDSSGTLGIVINMEGVKNPVLAARLVPSTPHTALAGKGAALFAQARGLAKIGPVPEEVRKRYERMRSIIASGGLDREYPHWAGRDLASLWNFDDQPVRFFSTDTVGAVALDGKGAFAVASSTGGASPMLLGRVGDTAMVGSGFYAGPAGAVAVTGLGEEIMRRLTAKTVYDIMARGLGAAGACAEGIASFPAQVAAGIIALSRHDSAAVSNRSLPWAAMDGREEA